MDEVGSDSSGRSGRESRDCQWVSLRISRPNPYVATEVMSGASAVMIADQIVASSRPEMLFLHSDKLEKARRGLARR